MTDMANIHAVAEELVALTGDTVSRLNGKMQDMFVRHKHSKSDAQRKKEVAKRRKRTKDSKHQKRNRR